MEKIREYTDGAKKIVIARYPNGKYYNHYNWIDSCECGATIAGGYDTLSDAEKMLKRQRPTAEKSKIQ